MIKTLWFFTKVAVLIGASIWLVSQPGQMDFHFLGYDVKIQTGIFLLVLCLFVLLLTFLLRTVRAILHTPQSIVAYREEYQHRIGYRTLARGLVAVAAGDAEKASDYSKQTQKMLKDHLGLAVLLEAQAARLRGDEKLAREKFEVLVEDKDMTFIGLRGLMKHALDKGDAVMALKHARKAYKLYPSQEWILKLVYDLEIKNHNWDEVLKLSKKAQKEGTLNFQKVLSDQIAIHLMRHDYDRAQDDNNSAMRELKMAYKLDPVYVPTIVRYAEYFIQENKPKKAVKFIETAWAENPHPDLAEIYDRIGPSEGVKDYEVKKLGWVEKLVELNPDAVESHVAAAKVALDLKFWGEAKAHLMAAQKIYPTNKILHMRAVAEQKIQHNDDSVDVVLQSADEAMPEKVWTCRETGMVYNEWRAIAIPHESFNTIIWDVPRAHVIEDDALAMFQKKGSELLIDPAA